MSLKGDLKMKRILALVLSAILISTLVGCGGNDETTDYSIEYVEAINQSTEQKETYKPDVDELEKNLPGSKYVLYYGSSGYQAECTISFFDDITRSGDVLKGHCKRTWYDGSSSDKVSYKYSCGKLYINQVSDDKIAMGYTDNTYDYIVYKDYLIKDSKIKNVKISSDGSFDALISGYLKFNSDGTVTVKEYKIDDTVIFEEGQYSGTYTRDGNIVTCKTYCSSTNCNNTWYMYIDDYGYVYSDVFVKPNINPIDFDKLQAEYPDACAWIEIPGIDVINYPIFQSAANVDDDFYLEHNKNGKSDSKGEIYIQKLNSKTFDDSNTVIYGQNVLNGTGFGQLKRFKNKDFFEQNRNMHVYIPGHILTYEIISVFTYDDRNIINSFDFDHESSRMQFFNECLNPTSPEKQTLEGATLETTDKIITLSTYTSNDSERLLVIGKLIIDKKTKNES